jgi:hypothetical protein
MQLGYINSGFRAMVKAAGPMQHDNYRELQYTAEKPQL